MNLKIALSVQSLTCAPSALSLRACHEITKTWGRQSCLQPPFQAARSACCRGPTPAAARIGCPTRLRPLAPELFKALNSSLKCEFGVTLFLPSMGFHHHVPSRCKDRSRSLALPELNVERPVALAQLAHSLHHQGRALVIVPMHTNYDGTLPVPPAL